MAGYVNRPAVQDGRLVRGCNGTRLMQPGATDYLPNPMRVKKPKEYEPLFQTLFCAVTLGLGRKLFTPQPKMRLRKVGEEDA